MTYIDDSVKLTFYGAARTVPGAKILLEIGKEKHMIDIGSIPGQDDAAVKFDFYPGEIDTLSLTHGHLDHMGLLNKFYKEGFRGAGYCTYATWDITKMQCNSAITGVQAYNNSVKGKKDANGRWIPFKQQVYSQNDVNNVMGLFKSDGNLNGHPGFDYNSRVKVSDSLHLTFYDAGHIPGSSQILFEINYKGRNINLLTCFDLGRTDYDIFGHINADMPLLNAPERNIKAKIDYMITESTYGDKEHRPLEESISLLEETILKTHEDKGVLVLPAFAIMRTQMLQCFLFDLYNKRRLPSDMIHYLSSPTAFDINKIMLEHTKQMDPEYIKRFENKAFNPFHFQLVQYISKMKSVMALLHGEIGKKPYSITASSGMGDMGRIVPILENTIADERNTIAATGYADKRSRMYKILAREELIDFNGKKVPLRAKSVKLSGFSCHADSVEIVNHAMNFNNPKKGEQFKGIFVIHGEEESCEKQKKKLEEADFAPETVIVPSYKETFTL